MFVNPFVVNIPSLYPLKTSDNFTVFWCFQGERREALGKKGLIFEASHIDKEAKKVIKLLVIIALKTFKKNQITLIFFKLVQKTIQNIEICLK